jgi:hypothetical protein
LPPAQIKTVYFVVDGDRWWADSSPPYTFGIPGAYLPARWVSLNRDRATGRKLRMHEFAVRVVTTTGEKWESETVRARTPPAPHVRPPGFGRFGRSYSRLSATEIEHPPPPGSYNVGHDFMAFIRSSLFARRGKHNFAWEISGDGQRVRLGTPIFLAEESHADAGSDFNGVDETLCAPDGPPATYAWSSTRGRVVFSYNGYDEHAKNLTLRAVKEPCAERRRLLEGVWEGTSAG